MKRLLILSISILQLNLIFAQKVEYANYKWDDKPVFPSTDTIKAEQGVIFLLERKINEAYINKDQLFEELSVYHRQVKVLTTDALAAYNRFYIPLDNVIEIVQIKARFVNKNGKVVELPKESIKEVENLENKGNYKAFAIEGAEVGGIIEYLYIVKKEFRAFNSIWVQSNFPKLNYEVIFAYPNKLVYTFKSYNGLPQFKELPEKDDNKYMSLKVPYIAPIEGELYSAYEANLQRYEYTLSYNKFNSLLRAYSWSKAGAFFWNSLFELTKDESKVTDSYLKSINLKGLDTRGKIRAIEEKVKTEIAVSKELSSGVKIDKVIELKQAHEKGITKLLVTLFQKAGIPFELVLTTDRSKRAFDPYFNCMNFLDDYLIYFPDIDDYLLPDSPQYRLGIVPDIYTGNYGIFFHPIKFNDDVQTLAYDLKQIPYTNYLKNGDSLFFNLKVDPAQLLLEVKTRRVFTGNMAQGFQSIWNYVPDERKTELINRIFNMGSDNNQLKSYDVKYASPSDIGVNPIIWNVVQIAPSLIESADNDIIVKIGDVIGEQTQLYNVKKRKLPVDVNNIMHYYRVINLNIPDGYTVTNPKDLTMKVEMMNNGKVSCAFTSDYTLEGNLLKVVIHEFYTEQTYPLSRFEEYRAVINAAADFNKKTVILTKK
jgi:energy-converting hydrogenase Eha subunit F